MYRIIFAETAHELEVEITGWVYRGWVPVGGPSLDKTGQWYQAVWSEWKGSGLDV